MKITRRISVLTLVLLVLISFSALAVEVTILHTNDIHGRIAGISTKDGEVGSYARIYTLIQQIKKNTDNVLILDGGDTLHGTNLVNLEHGLNAAALMGTLGYEAMVPGNHDFNYGYERLLMYANITKFPIVSANVEKDGVLVFEPYTIIEKGGYKFAIIGLSTPYTPIATHPNNVVGLDFVDPLVRVKEIVQDVKEKADFIILLSHIGYSYDQEIVAEVPEVDIIIGGHSHTEVTSSTGKIVAQTGEYGKYLGKIQLNIDAGQITSHQLELIPVTQDVEKNPMVDYLISRYEQRLDAKLGELVGLSSVGLVGEREYVRTGETNLGNLIADVMLMGCDADIAVTNGGGIRAALPAGNITVGNVYTVLPFDNTLVVIEVTGEQLKAALEHSVRLYPKQNGGFLHIAGLNFTFVEANPAGSRVENVLINGKPLMMNQKYLVATNDFLAVGGDGYTMFKEGKVVYESGLFLRDMMVDYLKEQGSVEPKVEGRITVK